MNSEQPLIDTLCHPASASFRNPLSPTCLRNMLYAFFDVGASGKVIDKRPASEFDSHGVPWPFNSSLTSAKACKSVSLDVPEGRSPVDWYFPSGTSIGESTLTNAPNQPASLRVRNQPILPTCLRNISEASLHDAAFGMVIRTAEPMPLCGSVSRDAVPYSFKICATPAKAWSCFSVHCRAIVSPLKIRGVLLSQHPTNQ